MADKGGLSVLYKRWNDSGRKHSCRWITNGGLKSSKADLQIRDLAKLLSTRGPNLESELTPYADYLREGLAAETLKDAINFLTCLSVFSTGGDARSFRAQVIEEVARPILAELGVRPGLARATYEAVHALVVEAVKGFDPRVCNVTWYSGNDAVTFDIDKRKITRERLLKCLADHGIAVPTDNVFESKRRESAMLRKLRAGGLGPTVLAIAPQIRQQWYELEVLMRPDIPNQYGDELGRLRMEVAVCAGEAESKHRVAGTFYGTQMHRELSERLSRIADLGRIRLTKAELLGCAYQLTDECRIWWSDWFDIASDAPWAGAESRLGFGGRNFIQGELPFD
jgi:hypothetical protein